MFRTHGGRTRTQDHDVNYFSAGDSMCGEQMKEEGGHLVQTVEHQAVLPDYYGEHQRTHAEDVVCFEPVNVGLEEESL